MTRIKWYRFGILRIQPEYGIETIERSLIALGGSVAQCARAIDEARASNDDSYDYIVDEETAFIENLLGIAFVLCQSYITFIVSHVNALHESCKENNIQLSTTDGSKAGILKLGSQVLAGTLYSQVQIIDAFANYFKHHEEWDGPWDRLGGKPGQTVKMLLATGANQYSSGNFRTAAEKLGNQSYEDMTTYTEILRTWGRAVYDQYDTELGSKGLL